MAEPATSPTDGAPVSAVISTWNRVRDVLANVRALYQQTRPPLQIIVVDNHSADGTTSALRTRFPAVEVIEMPDSRSGACATFNLGFRAARQPYVAILDDDVVLPPHWMERALARLQREPESTAMVTTQVVEPGMPDRYLAQDDVVRERYLCTFRGCGSLVRRDVLEKAGYYDELFFIYGNERDLAARMLNLGHRILLDPTILTFHGTPFGMKTGSRSLYYHVRNYWLYSFKNCAWRDLWRASLGLARRALSSRPDRASAPEAGEATGTIGLAQAVKETPRGTWVALKATLAALGHLPYCLRRRAVCRAPDFRPPLS